MSIPGVLNLLGGGYHTVSSEELERIRLGLANGYILRPHPGIEIGTKVRVRGGIFDGVSGVITELCQQCKVIIALSAVARSFSLEIGIEHLDVGPREVMNEPFPASVARRVQPDRAH